MKRAVSSSQLVVLRRCQQQRLLLSSVSKATFAQRSGHAAIQRRPLSTTSATNRPEPSLTRREPSNDHSVQSSSSTHRDSFPPPKSPKRGPKGIGKAAGGATGPDVNVAGSRSNWMGKGKGTERIESSSLSSVSSKRPVAKTPSSSNDCSRISEETTQTKSDPASVAPEASTTTSTSSESSSKGSLTLTERIKNLIATAKYLFKFYFEGVRQIWRDRDLVAEIRNRVKEREEKGLGGIRWVESQIIQTHQGNMRKLPLFVAILVILEEVLPLVVIYAPSLLPSTCILPSQLAKMRSSDERRRATAVQKLARNEDVRAVVDEVVQGGREGMMSDKESSMESSTLASLGKNTLTEVANLFALSTWGPKTLVSSRIEKHIDSIREDDFMLRRAYQEGQMIGDLGSWAEICNSDWLWKACAKRGLRSFEASEAVMQRNLIAWLQLTRPSTAESISIAPSSLRLSLLPLALYDGTPEGLSKLEGEASEESAKGLRQRTAEVVRSVVTEEKRRLGDDDQGGTKGKD